MSELRRQADLEGVALDADFVVPPPREVDERSLVVPGRVALAWFASRYGGRRIAPWDSMASGGRNAAASVARLS